jgi:16S rRNA (uracil1498-N3)-methyltransferase
MLKGKKMDFLYQKLTELSVEGLYPFWSRFSEARTEEPKQLERWQRISLEACKQCKRPAVLQCPHPTSFEILLDKTADFDRKIIFWEKEDVQFLSPFPQLNGQTGSTIILLGPEGGFSDSEIKQARTRGFTTVSLGPRVLRAETAAIAATSIVQHRLGNLSRTETIHWEILP